MLFYAEYQCDRDKQADAQGFFATMTEEQIANEVPPGINLIGRWHDVPNGSGIVIVETDDQNSLMNWMMGWSAMCTFPVVKPVADDATARKTIKAMMAAQES